MSSWQRTIPQNGPRQEQHERLMPDRHKNYCMNKSYQDLDAP